MAEVVLFHHALGLTDGVRAFADDLRAAGHTVHAPDLFAGRTFGSIDEGMAYVGVIGMPDGILELAEAGVAGLPDGLVYVGFSLGVVPAQKLAQTRPGARGAVLFFSAVPLKFFGGAWPDGVPLQIHMMEDDPIVRDEGDLDTARELATTIDGAELFLYPGDKHYFIERTMPRYFDKPALRLSTERVLALLDRLG